MSPAASNNSNQSNMLFASRPSVSSITRPNTASELQDTRFRAHEQSNANASFDESSETEVCGERGANRIGDNLIKPTRITSNNMQKSSRVSLKMELKITLPKSSKRSWSLSWLPPTELTLAMSMLAVTLLNCAFGHQMHELNSVNEISQQPQTNFSRLTRDVTNLRMTPDWRSVRLRWNYVQPNASQIAPAAFEIRYCELTSWLAEIKCRQRDVPVVGPAASECNTANWTVIANDCQRPPNANAVHQLASGELVESGTGQKSAPSVSSLFETHIFDLRALTNYTFDVQVARFVGEPTPVVGHLPPPLPPSASSKSVSMTRTRPRPARRLDLANSENRLQRVETKPFQAEALNCLANSSEVLINTGRYFGGRISVEGQPFEARCQLIGNRSSEQTSYLFRIDHELCGSKTIDSNRIETMILVHENKDILTHNTARFLVQCNIMQKSFTVKASVSLPKINGLSQQQQQPSGAFRPATILALAGKPSARESRDEQQVRLGSMPGVYRLIRAGLGDQEESGGARSSGGGQSAGAVTYAADSDAQAKAQSGDKQQVVAAAAARRSKELLAHEVTTRDNGSKGYNYQLELPKPVEVSSKILFVTRANNGLELPAAELAAESVTRHREARLDSMPFKSTVSTRDDSKSDQSLSSGKTRNAFAPLTAQTAPERQDEQTTGKRPPPPPMQMASASRERSMRTTMFDEEDSSLRSAVIMTNNHRVAGHFPALSQLTTAGLNEPETKRASETTTTTTTSVINNAHHSIRYSPADVSEYSLDSTLTTTHKPIGRDRQAAQHLAPTDPTAASNLSSGTTRSRSGRMRHIVSSQAPSSGDLVSRLDKAEGRMGDTLPPLDLMGAESALHQILPSDGVSVSHVNATTTMGPPPHPTLAQNITGALIRWSLKALGNLARKSLESLDERHLFLEGDNQTTGPNGELINLRDGFLVDEGQLVRSSSKPAPVLALARHQTDWPTGTTSATTTTTTTTAGGAGPQQPAKAATQSADLIQLRESQHLLPPTSLAPKQKQASTMALTTTTPSAPQVTPSGGRSTTKAPAIVQQKSGPHTFSSQKHQNIDSEHLNYQQRARAKSIQQNQANSLPPNESQVKGQVAGGLSPLWPVYVFWVLIGLGVLSMFVVYLVAFAPANIFKASATSRQTRPNFPSEATTTTTATSQQPRMGFLSQLNDAIYRHQLATPQSECTFRTSEMSSPQPGAGINTISRLLPHADVRSPRQQRRRLNDLLHQTIDNLCQTTAQPNLASSTPGSSELGSGAATRSTSAASTANMTTMRTEENYCKNHEQLVYTDYLLLSGSDCLANECGRESFA